MSSNANDPAALMTISDTGWSIKVDEKAKLKKLVRPAAMVEACAGEACILYNRKCDDAAHPTRCEYIVDVSGKLHTVSLTADSEAHATAAMNCFGVLSREAVAVLGEKLPTPIPLTALDKIDAG